MKKTVRFYYIYLPLSIFLFLPMLNPQEVMSQHANETLQVIHNRTSIRNFSEQPVSAEMVETLLRAAMAAPSSRNVQPWLFYVIEDRDLMVRLSEDLPSARMLAHAPLAIVVCGDILKGDPNEEQIHNWVMDCSAATQNLLLAAESLGLGAVWTGVHPYAERISTVRNALNLPAHVIPLSVIPVGYPAAHVQPKEKWDPSKVKFLRDEK
jgi:nitroreductase